MDLDKPGTAAARGGGAPSLESATPTPPETESAPDPRSGQPEPGAVGDNIVKGKVVLSENPDWSLVAKVFRTFIPECKTIEALKAFWNENSKELEQFKAGDRDKEPLIPQPPSEADTARA